MKFVLIGQPNCGKSTLFNQVSGYKAETGNFSGTSVSYIESKVRVVGDVVELVDLPGTYSLVGSNPAEREVFKYLTTNDYDVILNVIDASHLALGLGLTLELLELNKPIVLVLNMMDEADHIGIHVDIRELEKLLGLSVVPMIANKGRGVKDAFIEGYRVGNLDLLPTRQKYSPDLENQIKKVAMLCDKGDFILSSDSMGIKLLENDEIILDLIKSNHNHISEKVELLRQEIFKKYKESAEWVINAERHGKASTIAMKVTKQGERQFSVRDKLDSYLLHPFWGYIFLIIILYVFFQVIYSIGSFIEPPILEGFSVFQEWVLKGISRSGFLNEVIIGLIQGISGGVAIVLPYLMPFLIGLGILEDTGYVPRVAFLMDALMHKLGLHGRAIVPFILGYGCNVPSIMATRLMEDKKERFIAAALATMVPCAARLAVVFGLVAFYLGPIVALLIYLFNLFVIALTGRILSKLLPEDTPGMIMEIPVYRIPTFKTIINKTWFRVKEFIVEAWPILIVGSIVLSILNYFDLTQYLNLITKPLSWLLGLPQEVGMPLIFGVLRKELSLLMLGQALGSMNFDLVLSPVQMITFTVFVIFYMPCLATLAVIRKELGNKSMWVIMGITIIIATVSALAVRFISMIFL
ncbi:MAG: ferrous iron transport protein B [Anaerolineaceae bacterium]|nr:ferrous iron transport protein B [Anaerolineaceae bacterium]